VSAITVDPDAVDGLATDLTGLAADLAREADACRSASTALDTALEGEAGAGAASAARAWAASLEALARQVGTISTALVTLAGEYRVVDATLAAGLGTQPGAVGGPR